ncbi:MAG: hypothetical protein KAG66_17455, partial [Methylococcales bacterium]|nr:hypothetical protein [Methylococcales bacterium]
MSNLPFSVNLTEGYVSEDTKAASILTRAAESDENSAAQVWSAIRSNRFASGTSTETTSGTEKGVRNIHGTNTETYDRRSESDYNGIDNKDHVGMQDRKGQSVGAQSVVSDTFSAKLGVGMGAGGGSLGAGKGPGGKGGKGDEGGFRLPIPSVSIGAEKVGSTQQIGTLGYNNDHTDVRDSGVTANDGFKIDHSHGDNLSKNDGTTQTNGTFARSSITNTSSMTREEAISLAHSFEARARQSRERAQQLTSDVRYAESHGMQMSENMSQQLAEWYRREAASNPGLNAPGLHEVSMSEHQREVRAGLIAKFLEERREAIYDEVAPFLKEPDLASNLIAPAVSSPA